jgi:hypothetical protein
MKTNYLVSSKQAWAAFYLGVAILVFSCSGKKDKTVNPAVFLAKVKGKYTLYRNGKPFFIKGAGGFTHLKELHQAGGNTIRIWDTSHLDEILKEADENQIAVIVGLPIPDSESMDFYSSSIRVRDQIKAIRLTIEKYKKHPALLMWCIGNELNFPYKPRYNKFYTAFNDLVNMIHTEDPDHPVTTTILNINGKYIFNLCRRSNIDLISLNVFNRISEINDDLKALSWIWQGPYLLTEWGIDGPWLGTEKTAWGSYIESSSTKKAEIYQYRYEHNLPTQDPRFLGSCIFYWGQKQEFTHTWFSIFDENGAMSETVGTMQYLWTGNKPEHEAPRINYMLIDQKGARENLIYKPNDTVPAEVILLKPDSNIRNIKWEILPEDWYKINNVSSSGKPICTSSITGSGLKVDFITPSAEGPYRLFATLYDKYGNFASCNTPFYVVSDN